MRTKYIFFDMDGTLLPMDSATFAKSYFKVLTKKMLPHGYEPEDLINGINAGITAMQYNDGTRPNKDIFWNEFAKVTGKRVFSDLSLFDEFYEVDFQRISSSCGYNPEAKRTVALCKDLGYRVVIATEPIFPLVAMESRLRWAGINPIEVDYITSYETSSYCKPELGFYQELLSRFGISADECVMVGNDVGEDMPAGNLGMRTFLLTDCLINKEKADINRWEHGGYSQLQSWIRALD